MRVLIQRVKRAEVLIANSESRSINQGILIFVGIEDIDSVEDINWISNKIVNLRIFNDEDGVMNKSLLELGGDIMVISQFTLHAKTKKGNRPSYIKAARPEVAVPLYEKLKIQLSRNIGKEIISGEFGAHMDVSLVNDGPVTIWIDSKNKE